MVVHTLNLAKAGEFEFEANLSYIIILCLKTNKQINLCSFTKKKKKEVRVVPRLT